MSTTPANLLDLDYRRPPAFRPAGLGLTDCHTHLRGDEESLRMYFEAATLYGVEHVLSMTAWSGTEIIRRLYGPRVEFIAVPDFRQWNRSDEFQQSWVRDIERFAASGSRLCKFWAAPRALAEHGLTLADPWLRPMIDAALAGRMAFMVHVGDPDLWFATRYADAATFGTKVGAFEQLRWFLDRVAPRPVIGAHFIGNPEDLDHLDSLLQTYPHLMLDTSATKWVARETSRHERDRVRRFFARHQQRILFGSDLVLGPNYNFDHYASRYWVQRTLWETDYDGDSPIQDPDVIGRVRLRGANLPDDCLRAIYHDNYARLVERIDAMRNTP